MNQTDLSAIWESFLRDRKFDSVMALADSYPDRQSLVISFRELEVFSSEAADALLEDPDQSLEAADAALLKVVGDTPLEVYVENASVRVFGIPNRIKVRKIRDVHVGKLLAIEGMVRSASKAYTAITKLCVSCQRCGFSFFIHPKTADGHIVCQNQVCDRSGPFKRDLDHSKKTSKRVIQLQENPEDLRGGELPENIGVILTGDLVEGISPGNRVILNGIVKIHEIKSKVGETLDFEYYIYAVSVEVIEREFEEIDISPGDEAKIHDIASEGALDQIKSSIAPSIYGMDDVKTAMALQLVSSPAVHHIDGTNTRGDIHILLVGDPGIAKSQLLKYVVGLSPRGIYTSGKGASSAGLTAAAVKDEMTDGRWTIEAGALPMADLGLAAIDELDKMQDNDRDALHEGLEQQTISVNKAGINATLRCRCSVIAAANPKLGRFDRYEPVSSQIKLMPTLLSRFDLIFVLYDTPSKDLDTRISRHILMADVDESVCTPKIDPVLLRKYIAYSRKNIFPKMTEAALKVIQSYYLSVRAQYDSGPSQPIPTTARQLQALIRLSKASARLRLSDVVEESDASLAVSLTDCCLKSVGTDPETGKADAGAIDTGFTKTTSDRITTIRAIIRELSGPTGLATLSDILEESDKAGIDSDRVSKVIERLRLNGDLAEPRDGFFRLI